MEVSRSTSVYEERWTELGNIMSKSLEADCDVKTESCCQKILYNSCFIHKEILLSTTQRKGLFAFFLFFRRKKI